MTIHSPRLALFDLDLTILSVNSVRGWIKQERRFGRITALQTYMAAFQLFRYRYAGADMSNAISKGISYLEGQREDEFRDRVRQYWRDTLSMKVRPGAIACIEKHRQAGDHLALLTSSSTYMAEIAAEQLSIPYVLAMGFEVNAGRFTGRPTQPLCHGQGKVTLSQNLAARLGVTLTNSVFFTDSYSDLPMLEAVGNPMLVHPDRRLLKVGLQREWPVLHWD